jgi:adenylate cyclase
MESRRPDFESATWKLTSAKPATVHAFRGESDEAFKWLDRAYAEKDLLLYTIKYRTEFDKLHGDPRYKALLKKMNLPE